MKPEGEVCKREDLRLAKMNNREANVIVTEHHYLHRPIYIGRNVSYSVAHKDFSEIGVIMYGYPVFHTKEWLMGPDEPFRNGELVELCRLWLPDSFPMNSESCTIGQSLPLLRGDWPKIHKDGDRRWIPQARGIITFADAEHFHKGTIYKAANFIYLGWVRGRKATPGKGQGRWANAQREGVGQEAGIRKNAYLMILDKTVFVNLDALRKTYSQEE